MVDFLDGGAEGFQPIFDSDIAVWAKV